MVDYVEKWVLTKMAGDGCIIIYIMMLNDEVGLVVSHASMIAK